MQLTIDSRQPLEDVLRVVGALYDVELTVGAPAGRAQRGRAARQAAEVPAARRPPHRRGTHGTSAREVRAWAREHGYEVGEKGRIPGSLVEAYRASGR